VSTRVVITLVRGEEAGKPGRSHPSRAGNVPDRDHVHESGPLPRELGVRVIQPIPKMRGVGCLYMQSLLEAKVTPFAQDTLCLKLALNVNTFLLLGFPAVE
jgi:hypothetical protein